MRHTRRSRHWFVFVAAFACTAMMLFAPVRHRVAARAEVLQANGPAPAKFSAESASTTTPIKHLIVIVGENH
jgi:hypothetical protein